VNYSRAILLFGADRINGRREARDNRIEVVCTRAADDSCKRGLLTTAAQSRRRGRRVFGTISISRYAPGEARSPEHSIDPSSTHLSLGERAEGLHFREPVTSRGRYPALPLLHLSLAPFLVLALHRYLRDSRLALMSS